MLLRFRLRSALIDTGRVDFRLLGPFDRGPDGRRNAGMDHSTLHIYRAVVSRSRNRRLGGVWIGEGDVL
jgi:hypothetical protein